MPLARYFLFVGGALMALLLVFNAMMPTVPVAEQVVAAAAATDLPTLRIRSDRKWPERIVFDTSQPTIVPAAVVAAGAPKAAVVAQEAQVPVSMAAEYSAKARVRESFAQFRPAEEPVKPEPKAKPKRKVAKAKVAPPPIRLVSQQPQFGFFGNNTW